MDQLKSPLKKKRILEKIISIIQGLGRELQMNADLLNQAHENSLIDKDLGLDSLGRVELISRLERSFKIELADDVFSQAETINDLLNEIVKASPAPDQLLRYHEKIPGKKNTIKRFPPANIETLLNVLEWHHQHNSQKVHLRFYSDQEIEEGITYQHLYHEAQKISSSLQERGLKDKERVSIMLPTCQEYFFSFFGIMMAGGIPVPVYPPTRPGQLQEHLKRHEKIFNNCQTVFMITTREIHRLGHLLKDHVPEMRSIFTPKDLASPRQLKPNKKLSSSDIAFLQYTSGSTGDPKGVTLTHRNILSNIRCIAKAVKITTNDVTISWLPLYHDMGLIGTWLLSFYYGLLVVLMSPMQFLAKPERWLWAFHRFGGTLSASPNFGYELCLKRIKKEYIEGLNLSTWRVALNGSEPVSPSTIKRFSHFFSSYNFSPTAFTPSYGLAENTVGLTFPPHGRGPLLHHIDRNTLMKKGLFKEINQSSSQSMEVISCGNPIIDHQVRIVDPWDHELPSNQVGKIQFKGPSATPGYFNNPEKTKELYRDGWLETGDLGFIHDGEIYITGRMKDIIIKAGRNIAPQELEEMVGNIPQIRKGCVVVFADKDSINATEKLIIVAEIRELTKQEQSTIIKEIQALTVDLLNVGADDILLVPPHTILKTSSGKIRRASCQQLYQMGKLKTNLNKGPFSWHLPKVEVLWKYVIGRIGHILQVTKNWLYLIYIYPLSFLLLPPLALSIIIAPYQKKWFLIQKGVPIFLKLAGISVRINGLDILKKNPGPCVFVANHSSYLDGPVISSVLKRPVTFIAKKELQKNLIIKWILAPLHTLFVDRYNPEKAIQQISFLKNELKEKAISLFFFPEGTFSRVPGLMPFHMGAFHMASELNLPIIPITIHGTRSILREGELAIPRRGTISITIGEPLICKKSKEDLGKDHWSQAVKLKQLARKTILDHCHEPDLAPKGD